MDMLVNGVCIDFKTTSVSKCHLPVRPKRGGKIVHYKGQLADRAINGTDNRVFTSFSARTTFAMLYGGYYPIRRYGGLTDIVAQELEKEPAKKLRKIKSRQLQAYEALLRINNPD